MIYVCMIAGFSEFSDHKNHHQQKTDMELGVDSLGRFERMDKLYLIAYICEILKNKQSYDFYMTLEMGMYISRECT